MPLLPLYRPAVFAHLPRVEHNQDHLYAMPSWLPGRRHKPIVQALQWQLRPSHPPFLAQSRPITCPFANQLLPLQLQHGYLLRQLQKSRPTLNPDPHQPLPSAQALSCPALRDGQSESLSLLAQRLPILMHQGDYYVQRRPPIEVQLLARVKIQSPVLLDLRLVPQLAKSSRLRAPSLVQAGNTPRQGLSCHHRS